MKDTDVTFLIPTLTTIWESDQLALSLIIIFIMIGNDRVYRAGSFFSPSGPQPHIYKQKPTTMLQRELSLLNSVLKQNLWVPAGELTLDSLCFSCPDGQTLNTAYESDFHWLKRILFDIIDHSKHTKYLAWILTPSLLVDLAIVVFWQESVDVPHLCWRGKILTRDRALIVHARKLCDITVRTGMGRWMSPQSPH